MVLKMGPDEERVISCYNICFFCGMLLFPCVEAGFTRFPPKILYVSSGGTARFVWDYHVNNRDNEFKSASPTWYFINQTTLADSKIGYDDLYKPGEKWGFVISRATCPPRLLNPDRVRREPKSTLVITNVTTDDDGIYQCVLDFIAGNPEKHKSQLVVTVRPKFLPHHPENIYQFIEGDDLNINCTATGPPTPNVTWVNVTEGNDDTKGQGSGSAILHIPTITRNQAGVYECQARNNPKETASTTRTRVTVYYEPAISKELSSSQVSSWNGRRLTLDCTVSDGLPTPSITWYRPSGDQISNGITAVSRRSQVVITTNSADYGLYKCKATNIAGSDEHLINVTQWFKPGSPNVTILDQDIQASSVTVRWSKPDFDGGSPVIDYKVQVNSTNLPYEQITGNTKHELTGLTKNTKYEVRVYARNVVGYGTASTIIFTTKKRGAPPLPSFRLRKGKTTITLEWTKPDENGGTIKSYSIYQKREAGNTWTRIHVVLDLSNLTYVIQVKDLEPGQTYWFIVTAENEFGESEIGENKGETVDIPPTAVTATPTTTTKSGGHSIYETDAEEKCGVTSLAICATFLVVSVVLNVFLLLYIWRNIKRVTKNQAFEDPVYDNTIEIEENQTTPKPAMPGTPRQATPPDEYEPVRISLVERRPFEISSRVDGYSTASKETPSHYQALAGSSVQPQGPTYESLHRSKFEEADTQQPQNVPESTYQPLAARANPTHYQNLKNLKKHGNNRNDQSIV